MMHQIHYNVKSDHRLDPYLAWFDRYVSGFLTGPENDMACIRLKIDHSLRVLENGIQIGAALGLKGNDLLEVEVSALLHDVGRFPQYATHKTFIDAVSVNHGRLGAKTLAGQGCLRDLPVRIRKNVLGAVYCHNILVLPDGLPKGLDRTVRIVRDADKLDILGVLLDHVKPGGTKNEPVTLSLENDPARYSRRVLDSVLEAAPVAYGSLVYINDLLISLCGWIYDLNFRESFRELQRRGHIDSLLSLLPHDAEVDRLRREITTRLIQKGR